MTTSRSLDQIRSVSAAAALVAIACTGRGVMAEGAPPPETKPAEAPPPEAPAAEPAAQPPEEENPGSPKTASAGGSERKLPEHAGLFAWGPTSLIEPAAKDLEKWTSENLRLDLGFRAAYGFQQASGGPGERTAASQDYRVYGTFHMWNWEEEKKGGAGNLYFRFEWRGEMFTKIPPAQLSSQIGTLATTTYGFDEHDPAIVQFYYEQFLFDGGVRLRVGKLDPDDYFNLGRWADDYRYFYNTVFSAFPASNHPSGGLGFNAQWYISPEWTLTGGMTDVQGKKVDSGFDTVGDGKFIYGLDVTYSPKIKGWGQGNYRLGVEYRDGVEDKNKPEDTSFYINIDQEVAKDIAPFIRYGHGTGNSTAIDDVFAIGLGIDNCFNRPGDAFGVGFGLDTANKQVVSERDVEYVTELFYRFQLTRAMQFTVGEQVIFQPINAVGDDVVGVFEMRLVIDF